MGEWTLRQLRYAVEVARHGHFGRAAEAAMVSQPGLSAQVRALEQALGSVLFERGTRGVRPTPAGRELLARAEEVLRAAAELESRAADLRGDLHGPVRLSAIPTVAPYLLPAVVGALRRRWPTTTLQLGEAQTRDLVAAIELGHVDIGLLAMPTDTASLHVAELADEPFLLAMPEGHPLAAGPALAVSALRGLPMLLLEEGHCLHEHARAACALAGTVEQTVVRSASLSTLAQMVVAGAGLTLLPAGAAAVEAAPGRGLSVRRFREPPPGRSIALVWRRSDPAADRYEASLPDIAAVVRATVASGLDPR